MSGPRPSELRCFNENSPRPPVPGEERGGYIGRCQTSSPDLQPRRSTCDATCASLGYEPEGRCDRTVVMEEKNDSATPLACLQWTRSLHALLEDPKGLELFEHYLQQEGHIYVLPFWFACEGLKEERDPNKLTAIIKVLIRRFFQRPQLALPEDLRKEMTRRFREGFADKRMFDVAQREVERLIEETSYPNFLRSDVYLQHVRNCQSAERSAENAAAIAAAAAAATTATSSSSTSRSTKPDDGDDEGACDNEGPSSPDDEPSLSCASNLLPTLHEDSELTIQQQQHQQQQQQQHQQQLHHHHQQHHHAPVVSTASVATATDFGKGEMRLTKDMLMATQQFRALDVRPKPEAFAGIYLQPGASPYHASVTRPRAQYSSYNPVSRQDSELQSLSSDARTESDNLSLTDVSLDGAQMAKRNSRKQYIRHHQAMKKSAMMNRDPSGHEGIIPRTQRISREQTQPMNPEAFARQLIEKLERVRRDRENDEKLDRKLKEVDLSTSHSDNLCESSSMMNPSCMPSQQQLQRGGGAPRNFANALCEKLQLEDDSDQAILDQHVSRVWSDLTPSRSPKLASPRPRSPDKCTRRQLLQHHHHGAMAATAGVAGSVASSSSSHQYPARPPSYRSQRKEKDVFSTFSGDSGNVHDFQEAGELHGAGSMSSLGSHMPKSKSVPSDYADSLHKHDLYLQGQDPRYRRLDAQRSSSTKKSMTELTDSGVSVVSDVQPPAIKDNRLLNWLKETDGSSSGGAQGGGSGAMKSGDINAAVAKATRKKFQNLPQQPFVGDPGMPLLPQPHTATQLEEAKRRLEYEQSRSRQRYPGVAVSGKDYDLMQPPMQSSMQSNQSTLRRAKQEASSDFTIVVFSFCEEKVPYRTKIQGYNVTLKQFKDMLPKKGNYRYFFKTECEDLDMKVIQEEITDDSEVLPLWEGKVMAQVKALE